MTCDYCGNKATMILTLPKPIGRIKLCSSCFNESESLVP